MTKQKNHAAMIERVDPALRDRVKENMRHIAMGRKDPIYFGEYFLGLKFHDRQKIWLWLTTKTKILEAVELAKKIGLPLPHLALLLEHDFLKNILAPSNRFGKTFVTSVKHIWYNYYKIGVTGSPEEIRDVRYSTLNISPHSLQVDAAYRYVVDIFQDKFLYLWKDENGKDIKIRNFCRIKKFLLEHKQTRREIHFANNSMIKGVPTGEDQASSLAGTQFAYISYDEAPQSLHLQKELPAKIQSRLIDSGGPLDLVGTPEVDKPSHTYYQRITKEGLGLKNGWFTLTGALRDNIFIGETQKATVLNSIKLTDPEKYRQVAFGEFISSGVKLFDNVAIERMWIDKRPQPTGIPGHDYIIGVDWGFSDTGDPTIFYVIDYTEMRQHKNSDQIGITFYEVVYRESIKGGDPYVSLARLRALQQDFNDAKIIHDSTSMGGVIIKKMLRSMKVKHLHDFTIAKSPKDEMLFLMVRAMNHGRRIEYDAEGKPVEKQPNFGKIRSPLFVSLEEQLGNYKKDDNKIEQDEVMALSMPIWLLEKKYAGQGTKVFKLNMLARDPSQILVADDQKKKGPTRIVTSQTVIRERIIG